MAAEQDDRRDRENEDSTHARDRANEAPPDESGHSTAPDQAQRNQEDEPPG